MTSLVGGDRITKADVRLDAYGTIDELNCFLAEAAARIKHAALKAQTLSRLETEIQKIQNDLFTIGALLACPSSAQQKNLPQLSADRVNHLEQEIDWMTAQIPPLKQFILPGGTPCSIQFHICRTVARRAERGIVHLAQSTPILPDILEYMNRLSDYLFTCARFVQAMLGEPDIVWQKPES